MAPPREGQRTASGSAMLSSSGGQGLDEEDRCYVSEASRVQWQRCC